MFWPKNYNKEEWKEEKDHYGSVGSVENGSVENEKNGYEQTDE